MPTAPADLLRHYETSVLVPLVERAGLEPIREAVDFTLTPGTIVALMNSAHAFTFSDDLIRWMPLSVLYSDRNGTTGTVFSLQASFDPRTETVVFQQARIHGVISLVRRPTDIVWVDPHSGRTMLSYPLSEADKILMNSWHLFQGAVLPLLRAEAYRFAPDHEKLAFQATVIHHINAVYKGLV